MEQDIVALKQRIGQNNCQDYHTYAHHDMSEETEQCKDPEANRQFLYTLTAEQVITCCTCAYT